MPCLLVIEGDVEPPVCDELHEDWARAPVSQKDLEARAKSIRGRLRRDVPSVDSNNVLHYRARMVPISGAQAQLMFLLVEQFETVVARSDLMSCLELVRERATRNALDLQITRLRKRCARVGLTIVTARGRGYMLLKARVDPGSAVAGGVAAPRTPTAVDRAPD